MDFYKISMRKNKAGVTELYPDFKVGRSKDLMIRGGKFYAIWDEEKQLWSTDEYDVARLVDADLQAAAAKLKIPVEIKGMHSFGSNSWSTFVRFVNAISDNSHQLDTSLTFSNTEVKKGDYVSKRVPYPLAPGNHDAWDELVGTLYSVDNRAKIEWFIGSVVSGDSKKIQKFGVFYGAPASGKGTILEIIQKLFQGYTTTFDAKALGSNNASFATDVFKDDPLVALQLDGDMSRIEDNARLNSITAHDLMTMNEKYKSGYTSRVNALCLMGTNKPVKISDAKSGLIRRLIDIHPTGVKIPTNHYFTLIAKIDFELGAIAHHCLEVYRSMGRHYYEGYRPLEMMYQTDEFFNFIEANFDIFKSQKGIGITQAYTMYKEYCSKTGIEKILPQYKMREELKNYFDDWVPRFTDENGVTTHNYYLGFNANKFKVPKDEPNAFSLVLEEKVSLFDDLFISQPAQYSRTDDFGKEVPRRKWENVTTILGDIDTKQLHFVKLPRQHIVIDFDLKDEDGKKSLEKNLEAASVWPPTYAELSQSGEGIHLHYYYEGSVEDLAAEYSLGIEVKSLLGDASLRRRLIRCNNIPIGTLSSGLPVKEKKNVITQHKIKSEQGLREMIIRNFNKEFHAYTKPSVDFIKHILDEAYEDGVVFDITDMRPKIWAFASNSTNQPEICLRVVTEMKFKGKDVDDTSFGNEPVASIDDREVFYDVEVFPNLFGICWKFRGSDEVVKMVNPTPQMVEELFKLKLIGFNNRRYDNHILYAASMGYDNLALYKLSQKIINNEVSATFPTAYNLSYCDIWEMAAEKMTLKKWQIKLGIPHSELDLPWDEPVPEERWDEVMEYCANDVRSEEAVFEHRIADFVARQILAAISGLSVNHTTQNHTAKIIFGDDKNPQREFQYADLSKEFPGYVYSYGKSSYRDENPSEGGYVYAEAGIHTNVSVLDIASMHPTTIGVLNLFGRYTPNFMALVDVRLAIKAKDYEAARKMLGGKLAPYLGNEEQAEALSYALKIAINIVYGMTSAKWDNPFKDPHNIDNVVAKRGALFMIDLKHAVQEQGYTVAHIKTDSIKIPDANWEIIEYIKRFGEKYGYTFEHEVTYDKMALVNDAVYIARKSFWDEDLRTSKVTWDAVGAQFQHPVVFKTLFSKEELELKDYFEAKSVTRGTMYLDFEGVEKPMALAKEGMRFVGRTGLFVPVVMGGGLLYRVDSELKYHAVTGTKGYLWIEAENFNPEIHRIDESYYTKILTAAVKQIEKYGSFEEFIA